MTKIISTSNELKKSLEVVENLVPGVDLSGLKNILSGIDAETECLKVKVKDKQGNVALEVEMVLHPDDNG